MSIAYIANCNKGKHYKSSYSRKNVVKFITQGHTIKPPYFGCIKVDENDIAGSMTRVAKQFGKDSCIRIRHFMVLFPNKYYSNYSNYLNYSNYSNYGSNHIAACKLGQAYIEEIGKKYQALYGIHTDSDYVRLHVAFNPISYLDGYRFWAKRYSFNDFDMLLGKLRDISLSYGVYLKEIEIQSSSIREEF